MKHLRTFESFTGFKPKNLEDRPKKLHDSIVKKLGEYLPAVEKALKDINLKEIENVTFTDFQEIDFLNQIKVDAITDKDRTLVISITRPNAMDDEPTIEVHVYELQIDQYQVNKHKKISSHIFDWQSNLLNFTLYENFSVFKPKNIDQRKEKRIELFAKRLGNKFQMLQKSLSECNIKLDTIIDIDESAILNYTEVWIDTIDEQRIKIHMEKQYTPIPSVLVLVYKINTKLYFTTDSISGKYITLGKFRFSPEGELKVSEVY